MYNYIKHYIRSIRNIVKKNDNNILGRWNIHHCDKINHIKSTLANIDHCGDKICGDPIKNKNEYLHSK